MVKYDTTFKLASNEGDARIANKKYIIIHETGNANNVGPNSAYNEASFMKRNFNSAYTHGIAAHDRVYVIGEDGYVSWGAGNANIDSPYQIELARYSNKKLALAAYKNWIETIREKAKKFGIPLVLDGAGSGIKSHKWISDNIWGDHQDPYGYLATIGISKTKLANDITYGVAGKPEKSNSVKPSTAKATVKVKYDGKGKVRLFKEDGTWSEDYVENGASFKVFGFDKRGVNIGKNQVLPYQYATGLDVNDMNLIKKLFK